MISVQRPVVVGHSRSLSSLQPSYNKCTSRVAIRRSSKAPKTVSGFREGVAKLPKLLVGSGALLLHSLFVPSAMASPSGTGVEAALSSLQTGLQESWAAAAGALANLTTTQLLIGVPIALIVVIFGPTILGVIRSLVTNKPIRINPPVPLPVFGRIDVVIVKDLDQIQTVNNSPDVDRVHAYPTSQIPPWFANILSASYFYSKADDEHALLSESKNSPGSNYEARWRAYEKILASGHKKEDVLKVVDILKSGGDRKAIAEITIPLIASRFMGGKNDFPKELMDIAYIKTGSFELAGAKLPVGHRFETGQEDSKKIREWFDNDLKGVDFGPLNTQDVLQNYGLASAVIPDAILTLAKTPGTSISELFTTPVNCPVPTTPRIAVGATTFNGLLSKPTVPGKTIIIFKLADAASKTKDLFYTFGVGTPDRACPFKPFFENFLGDIQTVLVKGPESLKEGHHKQATSYY